MTDPRKAHLDERVSHFLHKMHNSSSITTLKIICPNSALYCANIYDFSTILYRNTCFLQNSSSKHHINKMD